MNLFGKGVIEDDYDKIKEIINTILFLNLSVFSSLLKQIINLQNSQSFEHYLRSKRILMRKNKWYYFLPKFCMKKLHKHSEKLAQISLLIWGLSRISWIKFAFLLLGLIGLLEESKFFQQYLFKISLYLSAIYLLLQTTYNQSYVDVFLKSFGSEMDEQMFKIGFYKYYNLFHGHLLKFKYSYDEIKIKRKQSMIMDTLVFSVFFLLYRLSIKKPSSQQNLLKLNSSIAQNAINFIEDLKIFVLKIIKKNMIKFIMIILLYISQIRLSLIHIKYLIIFVCYFLFYKKKHFITLTRILIYFISFEILLIYLYKLTDIQFQQQFVSLIGLQSFEDSLLYFYKEHLLILIILLILNKLLFNKNFFTKKNNLINEQSYGQFIKRNSLIFIYMINFFIFVESSANLFLLIQFIFLSSYSIIKKRQDNLKDNQSLKMLQKFILIWIIFDISFIFYFYIINLNINQLQFVDILGDKISNQSIGFIQQYKYQKIQIFYIGLLIYFLRYYYLLLKNQQFNINSTENSIYSTRQIFNNISNIQNPNKYQYKINLIWKCLQFLYCQNFNFIVSIIVFIFFYQVSNAINLFSIIAIIIIFQIFPKYVQTLMIKISLFIVISYQISHIILYQKFQEIVSNEFLNSYMIILRNQENDLYYYLIFALCNIKYDISQNVAKYMNENEQNEYLFENYYSIEHFQKYLPFFKKYLYQYEKKNININDDLCKFFNKNLNIYLSYYQDLHFIYLNKFTNLVKYLNTYILIPFLSFLVLIFVFNYSNFLDIPIIILIILIAKNFTKKITNSSLQLFLCKLNFLLFFIIFIFIIFKDNLARLEMYQQIETLVRDYFCDKQFENYKSSLQQFQNFNDYEYCQIAWFQYFLFEFTNSSNLILVFLILIVNTYSIHHLKQFRIQLFKVDQRVSFYLENKKKQMKNQFLFENFPSMILILFFFLSGFLDIFYQQESFLGLLYTIPGILIGINGYFYKHNCRKRLLQVVENFNFLLMMILLIYQSPLFKCPFEIDNRKFLGSNECSFIQQDIKNNFYGDQNQNISQQLYYFIYLNAGLLKINSDGNDNYFRHIIMIMFFFVILVIKQMWNFQENTTLYLIRRQQNKKKLLYAIKYILNYFITRFWTHDKYSKQKTIFEIRNKEIDDRIEQWEDIMTLKSRQNSFEIEIDEEQKLLQKKRKKWQQQQKKQEQSQAEKLVNSFSIDEPILEIQEVFDLYKENKNQSDINTKILNLQKQKCKEISQKILELQSLNIYKILNKDFLSVLELWNQEKNEIKYDEIVKEQINNIPDRNELKVEDFEKPLINKRRKSVQKAKKFLRKIIRYIKEKMHYNISIYLRLSEQENKNFKLLLVQFIQDKSIVIIQILLFLNLIFNGDLVSFIPLLLMLLIGITSNPFPTKLFWKFILYYFFILISIKLIYQLPVFCKTTPYIFSFNKRCENIDFNKYFIFQRIDNIIGIKKFYNQNSSQKEELQFSNFIFDYLSLLIIFIHIKIQKRIGLIDFIKTTNDYRQIPILNIQNIEKKFDHYKFDSCSNTSYESSQSNQIDSFKDDDDSESTSFNSFNSSSFFQEEYDIYQNNSQQDQTIFQKLKNIFCRFIPIQKDLKQYIVVNNQENQFEILQYEPLFLKSGKNLYKILFCIEIIVFFTIVLFYDTLLGSSNSFTSDLQKSQFSEDLVFIILKIIFIILINRICFCKRYSVLNHKIQPIKKTQQYCEQKQLKEINKVYQQQSNLSKHNLAIKYLIYFIIVLVTCYFFLYTIPQSNKNIFVENQSAKVIFGILFLYLNLKGLQIKYGYSNSDIGSPYTHKISPGENITRKVFMSIPFIFEIKTVLDWTITKTSLDLYQWFKLEDAYITLKLTKYQMQVRKSNKFPIDIRKKIIFGFCFLLFLLGLIILPILLFSTLNPNYVVNEPQMAQFSIKMWTLDQNQIIKFPLINNQDIKIVNIDEQEYDNNLNHIIKLNKHESIAQIKKLIIEKYTDQNWGLSPPKVQQLKDLIQKQQKFYLTIQWNIYHDQSQRTGTSQLSNTILIQQSKLNQLLNSLQNKNDTPFLQFEDLIPEVIYLNQSQNLQLQEKNQLSYQTVKGINIKLNFKDQQSYWELNNIDFDNIKFYIHCDFILGNMLGNTLKNMSVVGFYVTVVLAIGQIIKSVFKNITMRVIYEEMPQTNQLIEFCESIYMARKEKDLLREKKLYDILIRIYRSPELLIQLTGNYSKQLIQFIIKFILKFCCYIKFVVMQFQKFYIKNFQYQQFQQTMNNLSQIQQNLFQIIGQPIKVYGLHHPIRSFVYKLKSGNLWILSPVQADEQVFNQLDNMCGPQNQVKYLVSPNKMHWLFIKDWKKRYPNAIVITPKDLADKLKKQNENLQVDYYLDDLEINPQQWQEEIDFALVKGSKAMTEGVFFVKESGKVLISDLIQMHKFDEEGYKIQDKILYRMAGCGKDGGMPGVFKYSFKWPLGNKKLYQQSIAKIHTWNFNEIFLLHGNSISENAQQYLKKKLDI